MPGCLRNFQNLSWVCLEKSIHLLLILNLFQTYDIDYQTADSASTASAMFSGVKTKYKTLGYDSTIDRYNSSSMLTATEVGELL